MAQYKLLEESFAQDRRELPMGPRIFQVGEILDVADNVIPGPHMVPVDSAARLAALKAGLVNERGPATDQEVHNLVFRYL
jgi:hypothetical protein